MSPVVVIAEGYATGVTLARYGKAPTLAAYQAENHGERDHYHTSVLFCGQLMTAMRQDLKSRGVRQRYCVFSQCSSGTPIEPKLLVYYFPD